MRIALVSPYDLDRPGGVQNHVQELAATLAARGHTVETFAPGTAGKLGSSITVNVNGSQAPISVSRRAVARLDMLLTRFGPDVVHVHEPGVPLIGWAATRRRPTSVTVATCHAYTDTARILPVLMPIGRVIGRRIDRLIAVSDAAVRFHSRALRQSPDAFTIIGNGIDLRRFNRREPRHNAAVIAAPALVYLGRLEKRKGVDVLLRAFVPFAAQFPHASLVIVGDGPERATLEQAIPEALRAQVTFTGRVSDEERARRLADADILVAPARGGESFGIVLLEALASGCTLVASDIPGYRSVVRDGIDGWLVPPDDPAALNAALGDAVRQPEARAERRHAGFARAEMFSWPAITDQIEQVYAEACAVGRRNTANH
jgi:phosphatidyl-myo-inositol alpha-mannosyltransferase